MDQIEPIMLGNGELFPRHRSQILRNPAAPWTVKQVRSLANLQEGLANYEQDQLVICDDLEIPDFDKVTRPIVLPQEGEVEMFPIVHEDLMREPLPFPVDGEHDESEFKKYADALAIKLGNDLKAAMPNYKFRKVRVTWRYYSTDLGEMHLDINHMDSNWQPVRFLINLDRRPRLCLFGPTVWEVLQACRAKPEICKALGLGERFEDIQWGASVKERLEFMANKITGNPMAKYFDFPTHMVMLQPRSAWLSNPSATLHCVGAGRCAVVVDFFLEEEFMIDAENSYRRKWEIHTGQAITE